VVHHDAFELSQFTLLQHLVKHGEHSVVGKHFSINDAFQEASFDDMHAEFKERVPVTSLMGFTNFLRTLTLQSRDEPWQVLRVPHLLQKGEISNICQRDGGAYPLSPKLLENTFIVEDALLNRKVAGLPKVSGKLFHITDEADQKKTEGYNLGEFRRIRMGFIPKQLHSRILPDMAVFDGIGKSRYQRLHKMIDLLEEHGSSIEVIVARPQILCDLAVIMSQRYGMQKTLVNICPNLRILAHYAEPIGPYSIEVQNFTGSTKVSFVKILCAPSGLLALQTHVSKGNHVALRDETGVFYEFIPFKDLKVNGTLQRHHRRLHAGNVQEREDYLLVISNTSGLLGLNTQRLVRVISKKPFTVEYLCFSKTLNGFGQRIRLDVLESVLSTANLTAQGHGFNIREYMVGDDLENNISYWMLEINCPLASAPQKTLQTVVNTIHHEMCLQNEHYKSLTESGRMPLPTIVFVPVGTFSALTQSVNRTHIDDTDDAEHLNKILKLTSEKLLIQPEA